MILPTLGGIGGGIITWLRSVHPAFIFFAILGGIALGLFISNEISAKRFQKRFGVLPQEVKTADWMATAVQDDVRDLSGCIRVSEPHICWKHLEEREDAYIEFNFNIWSSSVLLLEISKQVEGHTYFRDGELERIPEITQEANQLSHLRRSRSALLTIRQWLSFPVKARMKTEYGSQVEFCFSRVNIPVVATLPDGSQGPTCRLPIPNVVRTQMPNHPNAPTPDTEGSQN